MSTHEQKDWITGNPVFEVGEKIICTGSHGYALTAGKEYEVLEYDEKIEHYGIGFTWPAYVTVMGDDDKKAFCHARRFKHKPQS